jgi:putative transposase
MSAPLRSYAGMGARFRARCDCRRDATIRVLSVVDAYTRECLALEADIRFASQQVTRVLGGIIVTRMSAVATTVRNSPVVTFSPGVLKRRIKLGYIQPGKPTQNAQMESFDGRPRRVLTGKLA